MSAVELLALSVALALDAFAVAVGTGCALPAVTGRHYARLAGAFGFFQFMMPVIGWFLGATVRPLIERWDHWIAFALLAWIGWGMLRSSPEEKETTDPTTGSRLWLLAIATSIDALAVGLSFSLLRLPIWGPATLIGLVCAVITSLGLFLGQRLASAPILGRRAEILGGLVLIAIGLKILHEHGVF